MRKIKGVIMTDVVGSEVLTVSWEVFPGTQKKKLKSWHGKRWQTGWNGTGRSWYNDGKRILKATEDPR